MSQSIYLYALVPPATVQDLVGLYRGELLSGEQLRRLKQSPALRIGEVKTVEQKQRIAAPIRRVLDLIGRRPVLLNDAIAHTVERILQGHNFSTVEMTQDLAGTRRWLREYLGRYVVAVRH